MHGNHRDGGPPERLVERLVEGLAEQRADLELSHRRAGELIGVSRSTVQDVERGRNRNLRTIVQLRTALMVYELYGKPAEPLPDWLRLPFEVAA